MKNKKWMLLGGLIALAMYLLCPGMPAVASTTGSTAVSGIVPLTISDVQVSVTSCSATITWNTNGNANSEVLYGTTTSYGKSVVNSSLVSQHSITITGLCAGTYYYEIESIGTFGGTQFTATYTGSFTIVKLTCTCTAVTSSNNPSTLGQPVYFTAKVTPSAATGTVQFTIDGADFGSAVTLISGSASSASISTLAVGTHTVTAVYSGDSNYATSTGTLSGGQVVKQALTSTTTLVTSSTNPSVYGQSITFTAKVSPSTATGTIQFMVDGIDLGSPIKLTSGSATSAAISTLSVGNHAIAVVYSGDSNHATSTGTLSGGQTVNKANSSISVTSSLNPSTFGQSVTFSATISAASPGRGTPTGSVQFSVDGKSFGSPVTLVSSSASIADTSLAIGTHTVTVAYNGDSNFNTSTSSTLTQMVNKAASATSISSSVNPSVYGQVVTFNAKITPSTATGTIQFTIDGKNFGSAVPVSGGSATSGITSTLPVGNHTVTAIYSGDSNISGSTSPSITQTVNKASTVTSLISSANPSTYGQAVTFTATVMAAAPGTGVPTGTVTFEEGITPMGTATLVSGKATYTTSSLNVCGMCGACGSSYCIIAVYSGDTNFTSSIGSLSQSVNKANTTTALTASPNKASSTTTTVTFTAVVTAVAPGAGTPPNTDTVTFKNGTATMGTVALSSGQATYSTKFSTAGTYSISAIYNGDANYNVSTSNAVPQVVK
jgi:hypothetical protein